MRTKITFTKSDDPEKLVTPGIVYVRASGAAGVCHLIQIGWWHWSMNIFLLFK